MEGTVVNLSAEQLTLLAFARVISPAHPYIIQKTQPTISLNMCSGERKKKMIFILVACYLIKIT